MTEENTTLLATLPEFVSFPKMGRFSREVIITEKIDGTNAQIFITDYGDMFVGSRTRWITPSNDNHGFARWCEGNRQEILKLGPGRHFGEWWGSGIQRGYGLKEKRLSLFNVQRWCLYGDTPEVIPTQDPRVTKMQDVLPECIGLVPILARFETMDVINLMVDRSIEILKAHGSYAAAGFMDPEGIVIFHTAGNVGFKKTIEGDDKPKSLV